MMYPMRTLVSLLFVAALCMAQDAAKQTKQPYVPKNLKVLKEGTNIRTTMADFSTGLGVQCNFCHAGRDMASDENPKKEIARHMITMLDAVNANFTDGKAHVSCYTCHRGETEPKMAGDAKPAAQ
jgi:hypothetical protein